MWTHIFHHERQKKGKSMIVTTVHYGADDIINLIKKNASTKLDRDVSEIDMTSSDFCNICGHVDVGFKAEQL